MRPLRMSLAFGLVLAAGCKKAAETAPPAPPPAPVSAVDARTASVPVYLDEIGRIAALEMVTIQPQVSGRIVERHFTDGADVKSGDLLFSIDARPFQARLASAQATLAQSKATLDLARLDFARSEKLLEEKAISQQDYDTNKNSVAVAEARVKQGEAAVDEERLHLEYCSIHSPLDGRAGQRLVDVGNIVEANQTPLLVIQKLDPLYADFTVAEKSLAEVQRRRATGTLKVEVRLPEEPEPAAVGELTFLDNAVDRATGTVKLRATVPNPERRLWPGRFVKVRLVLAVIEDAVLIPAAAVQLSARGHYVFVVSKESKAEMRPVTLGQRHGDQVVIEQGLQAGDPVVTTIHQFLFPGGNLQVVTPAAQGETP